MAIFIDELTTYLAAQAGGSWTAGTNVFNNNMPKTPVTLLSLFESGGEAANLVTDVFTQHIRLLARATNFTTAKANFETAFTALNRVQSQDLTTFRLFYVESIDSGARPIENEPQSVILESWFRVFYKKIAS